MNPFNPYLETAWGDGVHRFRLNISGLLELEGKCDAGVMAIYDRLIDGKWKLVDVRETIRIGLIGGGKAPTDAHALTARYVDDRPLLESYPVALQILAKAMNPPKDIAKKAKAAQAKEAEATGLTPPASTETAQS